MREKELFQNLKLKDFLETSEGRYALIDENKVTYFLQQWKWLGEVLVKHVGNNQVELKEIDGETIINRTIKEPQVLEALIASKDEPFNVQAFTLPFIERLA